MKKYVAEFIGTFTLVLFGCGTAVVSGQAVGHLGIAFAFGFALLAMCYGIGPVSGCHVNPAVSLGVFTAGRMTAKDLVGYIVSQCLGAIAAAAVLAVIAQGLLSGYSVASNGLGQDGWGQGYQAGYSLSAGDGLRICRDADFCDRHPGLNAGRSAHANRRSGNRNHAGGDPHLRNQHHRSVGKSCPQSGPCAPGGRQSPFASVDVSHRSQYRGNRFRSHLPYQGSGHIDLANKDRSNAITPSRPGWRREGRWLPLLRLGQTLPRAAGRCIRRECAPCLRYKPAC